MQTDFHNLFARQFIRIATLLLPAFGSCYGIDRLTLLSTINYYNVSKSFAVIEYSNFSR